VCLFAQWMELCLSVIKKIKKEIGDFKDLHGLAVFVFNRVRMYAAMFGIAFLVLERLFAVMGIELGISEYINSVSGWMISLAFLGVFILGVAWMYVDLKFIVPSERRSSTGRDPIIFGIVTKLDDLSEKVDGIRSDSELQQRQHALPLIEAIGKTYSKNSSGG